jgi:hypothetical protein
MRNNLFLLVKGIRTVEDARPSAPGSPGRGGGPAPTPEEALESFQATKQQLMLQAIQKMNNMNQINALLKNHANKNVQRLEGSITSILQLATQFMRLHQGKGPGAAAGGAAGRAPGPGAGTSAQLIEAIVGGAKEVVSICALLEEQMK